MTRQKFFHNTIHLSPKLDKEHMPTTPHQVKLSARDSLRQQMSVRHWDNLIVAAMKNKRWDSDRGKHIPSIMPLAGIGMEPLGIFRHRLFD